jgi:hypothetical protein
MTQCAGRARRSAGLQAEYVQGSEDLRQLLVATMAVSFPTLKEDIINSPMPTATVSQRSGYARATPYGPQAARPQSAEHVAITVLLNIGWRPIVKHGVERRNAGESVERWRLGARSQVWAGRREEVVESSCGGESDMPGSRREAICSARFGTSVQQRRAAGMGWE